MEQKCESAHSIVLARQRLQMRLQDLFMTVSTHGPSPLYTAHFPNEKFDTLVLTFDNGIDPDPQFCGEITGKLFLDQENNFCLAIWPKVKQEEIHQAWRKEVLAPKIAEYSFEFLSKNRKLTNKEIKAYSWHPDWEKERSSEIPSQIRLSIRKKDGSFLQYAFYLAVHEPVITYCSDGREEI